MNINEEFPSKWAKATVDFKSGDILTFVDGGKTEESKQYGKKQLIFIVKVPDGQEKEMAINKQSRDDLSKKWGVETDKWAGKKVVATIAKMQVAGEMRDVTYLSPFEGEDEAEEVVEDPLK